MNKRQRLTLSILIIVGLCVGSFIALAVSNLSKPVGNLTYQAEGEKYFYVSPSGNDTNPGTEKAPFLTAQKAASVTTAGTTVIFEDGVYGRMRSSRAGTASARITFKARNKGKAIFRGDKSYERGVYPIMLYANYVTLDGLWVEQGPWGGIKISANDLILRNMTVFNNGMSVPVGSDGGSGALAGGSDRLLIEKSEFSYNGEHGLYIAAGIDNTTIKDSHFHHNGQNWKGNGVQVNAVGPNYPSNNILFEGNVFHDNLKNGLLAMGMRKSKVVNNLVYNNTIHVSLGSLDNQFINNTIYTGSRIRGFILGSAGNFVPNTGNTFSKNIFVTKNESEVDTPFLFRTENPPAASDNNVLWTTKNTKIAAFDDVARKSYTMPQWQALGFDKSSLYVDPLFEDVTNNNFTVKKGSPATGKGYLGSSYIPDGTEDPGNGGDDTPDNGDDEGTSGDDQDEQGTTETFTNAESETTTSPTPNTTTNSSNKTTTTRRPTPNKSANNTGGEVAHDPETGDIILPDIDATANNDKPRGLWGRFIGFLLRIFGIN